MNATLVVSISVLMIGAAIAIYTFLTGNSLADGEDFSLKFAAEVVDGDGGTYDSEVYFCTGGNCKYYEDVYASFEADYDLPEFFALVGVDLGDNTKVLSELTLGWMFKFENDVLTECRGLAGNETDYDPIAEAKEIAEDASINSFDVGSSIDFGEDGSLTITSHDIGYDPDVKMATVLGLKMPTPEDCGALVEPLPAFSMTGEDATADPDTLPDYDEPDMGRRLTEESSGRQLWNNGNRETSYNLWRVASAAYDGANDFNGGWQAWAACTVDYSSGLIGKLGQARAQFFYKNGQMVLAFAGSDDTMDWIHNLNAIPGGPGGKYHRGFYNYQNDLQPCVNKYRNMLSGWGIQTDYIVGHSLGGASATVYAQEHGQPVKGVATYGAPKTNQAWGSGSINGWRFQHSDDPVPSSMCFLKCALLSHKHVITNGYEMYDKLVCGSTRVTDRRKKCQKKWWKFWCWFEVFYYWVRSCGWQKRMYKLSWAGFAHPYFNLVWGVYGAISKHGAYGDYPSMTV
mmetsp:Transcript_17438/g.36034  ORF Transcript_17438/g.36034 Transcript_17438/m.36034 type:complete len:514 (-) Transcript_17438:311-1852(-)|eukprot:CAMPEP_0118658946 /NCGR_PEP_ID=MMETSP0785-20121206/14842_1 /TAXON_ID=91992 /ORGANISM="Bolidomonas pacifica, Strain CCMP 1866" /LENGTH=513 /DNA_ID=CAMNT_0006552003 /DNA_START=94 /DNA_END=1635 /DNA_ORIENTATION=+